MRAQRVAFILSHPLTSISGELRELEIAKALATTGVRVRLFRPAQIAESRTEKLENGVEVSYRPVDDGALSPHDMTSESLLAALEAEKPDLIVIKGIGYQIARSVVDVSPPTTRIAVIIGGSSTDPKMDGRRISAWFFEYDEQGADVLGEMSRFTIARTLPKYIDWNLVGERASGDRVYDIVSVGDFSSRKNHRALFPLFDRHAIAILGGDGSEREEIKAVARRHERVHIMVGDQAFVFDTLRKSRIMVHPSLWEGFPRAIAEAFAVGLPVIALSSTVKGGFENGKEGYLVSAEDLIPTATKLLGQPEQIRQMGDDARAFAEKTYSIDNICNVFNGAIKDIPT